MSTNIKYKVVNGTSYHDETPDEVVRVLENARANRTRIVLDYGDVKTGESWGEVYDIAGYIGRSTGSIKVPLLIHNARSMGGGAILDHCIISIKTSAGKYPLYQLKK
jgi:hypothetical protein